ncbi:MAG: nucleotide exchange factor GrpE [Spartobacteria bacterium]|nr:nucleotide exchange factor GrpE [Spartobacteria bacterium]
MSMKKNRINSDIGDERPEAYPRENGAQPSADTLDEGLHSNEPAQDAAPEIEILPPEEADTVPRSQFVRLQADFDNFKKRTRREQSEWYQRANENLVEEILPALDHFEMGLQTARAHQTESAVVDGFQLVYDQLMSVLTKFGLSPVDAAGALFDPHQHEAVTYLPSPNVPAETVIDQTRRGYRLGEKLIRPAQVVVSSGAPDNETTGEE